MRGVPLAPTTAARSSCWKTRTGRSGTPGRSATGSWHSGLPCSDRRPGRFALMAAIAAVHDQAPTWDQTDWTRIREFYDELLDVWPSPVVALNRAIAVGFADGSDEGLAVLDALRTEPCSPATATSRRLGPTSWRASTARRGGDGLRGGDRPRPATPPSATSSSEARARREPPRVVARPWARPRAGRRQRPRRSFA